MPPRETDPMLLLSDVGPHTMSSLANSARSSLDDLSERSPSSDARFQAFEVHAAIIDVAAFGDPQDVERAIEEMVALSQALGPPEDHFRTLMESHFQLAVELRETHPQYLEEATTVLGMIPDRAGSRKNFFTNLLVELAATGEKARIDQALAAIFNTQSSFTKIEWFTQLTNQGHYDFSNYTIDLVRELPPRTALNQLVDPEAPPDQVPARYIEEAEQRVLDINWTAFDPETAHAKKILDYVHSLYRLTRDPVYLDRLMYFLDGMDWSVEKNDLLVQTADLNPEAPVQIQRYDEKGEDDFDKYHRLVAAAYTNQSLYHAVPLEAINIHGLSERFKAFRYLAIHGGRPFMDRATDLLRKMPASEQDSLTTDFAYQLLKRRHVRTAVGLADAMPSPQPRIYMYRNIARVGLGKAVLLP